MPSSRRSPLQFRYLGLAIPLAALAAFGRRIRRAARRCGEKACPGHHGSPYGSSCLKRARRLDQFINLFHPRSLVSEFDANQGESNLGARVGGLGSCAMHVALSGGNGCPSVLTACGAAVVVQPAQPMSRWLGVETCSARYRYSVRDHGWRRLAHLRLDRSRPGRPSFRSGEGINSVAGHRGSSLNPVNSGSYRHSGAVMPLEHADAYPHFLLIDPVDLAQRLVL